MEAKDIIDGITQDAEKRTPKNLAPDPVVEKDNATDEKIPKPYQIKGSKRSYIDANEVLTVHNDSGQLFLLIDETIKNTLKIETGDKIYLDIKRNKITKRNKNTTGTIKFEVIKDGPTTKQQ